MQIAYDTLRLLGDGKFHSGTSLAQQLGVSRSSIWKGMYFLRQLQVSIQAVSGRGYRWDMPSELLDKKMIVSQLAPQAQIDLPRIDVVNVVDSTNDYLTQRLAHNIPNGTVCVAEAQTAGKGRIGRKWISPFGANIYCSLYWQFSCKLHDLSGLTLVVGIAVLEALKEIAPLPEGLGIKWPNDIWYHQAKLAGILTEIVSTQNSHSDIIIGIGLNTSMPLSQKACTDWIDLERVFGCKLSRNRVIAHLLNRLSVLLPLFTHQGFSPFSHLWEQYDLLAGKKIQLTTPHSSQIGIAQGINERGELCVEIENTLKAVRYGEVSIRAEI